MNKRIEKIVKNYEAGKITVRRDQLKKAVEEGAFDYMIYRGYDEVYNVEPVKMEATVENIPDYWFRGANIYVSGIKDNVLKVSMCYGYSYKQLYVSLEEKKEEVKEVATTEEVNNVEGVKVVFNEEKNGIEITFASKDLATEEIRTELKAAGFRYFFKLGKWIAKQNAETIATVNKLFNSNKEVEEIDVTEEVETMLQDENTVKAFTTEEMKETNKIVNTVLLDNMEVVEDLTAEPEELNDNLIIHIEGEGSVEKITTSNVIKATENINKRIMAEYNEDCGGYSKTFITITVNGDDYKFRYDIDKKLNLIANIFKFMLDQEKAEYNYTMENMQKFKWINEENYKNQYKTIFSLLEKLIEENNIDVKIESNPYTSAVEEIKDAELYEVSASHNWVMKDNRLIKNEYFNGIVLATGKAIKEFINEGKRIDIFNLKRYKGNLNVFMEGLYKCDTGKLISLIPTKEDRELMTVKMLPRLKNELARI